MLKSGGNVLLLDEPTNDLDVETLRALEEALLWRDRQTQLLSLDHQSFLIQGQRKKSDRELQQVRNTIKQGIKAIILLTIMAISSIIIIFNFLQTINGFDRNSSQIIGQYEFAPIESLKAAIVNASNFKNIQSLLLGDSTPTPRIAIQKLVDSIQEIDEINTYQNGINAVYYCDHSTIFAAGSDGTINIWERDKIEGKTTIKLEPAALKINSVSHPSSKCDSIFATGSSDGQIRIWTSHHLQPNSQPLSKTPAHKPNQQNNGGVQNVRLTKNGRYVFSTGKIDGKLKKWRIENGDRLIPIWEQDAHKNGVISLNFNGKQDRIGTAGRDGTAKLWDLDGNLINTLTGHTDSVNSITFCSLVSKSCPSDGYEIATSSNDGTVRLWKAEGKYFKKNIPISTHLGQVRAVRFSPDGKLLATASAQDPTASNGSSVRIWDLQDHKLVTEFKGHHGAIESMRFKPDRLNPSELATSGQEDSIIRIWQIPQIMPSQSKHQGKITSVRFNPSNPDYFITAGEDGTIRWWHRGKDSLPKLIANFDKYRQKVKFETIRIHPTQPQLVAVGDSTGSVRLLKIADLIITEVDHFETHQGEIESIDWNYQPYNGQQHRYLLATTGSEADNLKVWEVDVKQQQLASPQPIYTGNWALAKLSVRFSEDGENLAIGAAEGKVKLIENINRQPTNSQKIVESSPDLQVKSKVIVRFSPDSRSLAIISHDGKIWQLSIADKFAVGKPTETYQAGTENASFSQDNKFIATGGAGAAVRLWDLQGRQTADFRGYWGTVKSINFSQDGKYILAGGDDGIPRVWRIDRTLPELIEQGCDRLKQAYFKSHSIDPELSSICAS